MARSGLKHGAKGEGRRTDYLKKRISRVLKRGFLDSLTRDFLFRCQRERGEGGGKRKKKGGGIEGGESRKGEKGGGGRGGEEGVGASTKTRAPSGRVRRSAEREKCIARAKRDLG